MTNKPVPSPDAYASTIYQRPKRRDKSAPPVKAGGDPPAHVSRGEAGMLIAPPGQCEFCDRRRAYLARAMRRSRKRRKEQKK
jgi:hypothetical protein